MKMHLVSSGSPSGVFLGQDLTSIEANKIFGKIKKICLQHYPFESGGYVTKNLEIKFFKSVRFSCFYYLPDFNFYLDVLNKKSEIYFTFHSHLSYDEPSDNDIKFIKVYGIDSLIYIMNQDKFLSVNTKYERNYFSWPFENV